MTQTINLLLFAVYIHGVTTNQVHVHVLCLVFKVRLNILLLQDLPELVEKEKEKIRLELKSNPGLIRPVESPKTVAQQTDNT